MMTSNSGGSASGTIFRLLIGVLLLLPALILGYTTLVSPSLRTLEMAGQDIRITGEPRDLPDGNENFDRLTEDARYQNALDFTLSLVGRRVIVVSVLPLLIALALNEFGRLVRIPIRLLLTIPLGLAIPIGFYLAWTLALNPQFGLFKGENHLGNPQLAPDTLRDIDSFFSLILSCGVGVIVYLVALRGTGTQAPRGLRAILPALAVWLLSIITATALALHTFTMPYILTAGGPGNSTATLGMYIYQAGFQRFQLGYAAAMAWQMLLMLGGLGIVAGLIVVLTGLRLETIPPAKPVGFLKGPAKIVALIILVAVLAGVGWAVWNGVRPVVWAWQIGQQVIESPITGTRSEKLPIDRVKEVITEDEAIANTQNAAISSALLVQLAVTVLAAFAIGAIRPLGRFSEVLLLLFSPWLFTGILPLSLRLFLDLREAGTLNSTAALAIPFLVNVPILFVLTLFFRGQSRKWRQREVPSLVAFITGVVLPSIPLILLLGLVAIAAQAADVFWSLIVVSERSLMTVPVTLLMLRGQMGPDMSVIAGALALFGVPAFLMTVGGLAIFQIFYFDRLALGVSIVDRGES